MGRLLIPLLALSVAITFAPIVNRAWVVPSSTVGWGQDTGWIDTPNQRIVLMGHTPGVLTGLDTLSVGDWIMLTGDYGTRRYQVEWVELRADDALWWPDTSDPARLLIITCEGKGRRIVGAVLQAD
jgi:hypothetical protein